MAGLIFVTSNANKLKEVSDFFGIPISKPATHEELPEIQSVSVFDVIKEKSMYLNDGEFCEDTGLGIDVYGGYPGALIKFPERHLGLENFSTIYYGLKATATTIFGLVKEDPTTNTLKTYYFEGSIKGTIVSPRGTNGFSWDTVFQPDGYDKTYAEMTKEEKNSISQRTIALRKFKKYIEEGYYDGLS
uniref:Non-canonical purine NTP pyrophosphatase n=1 Tax=viral metagenome TaxID=1070528 RepID=A0A6C0EBZ8_9ZZZZ